MEPQVIWGRGFRPFFLLAGAYAIVEIALWLGVLRGLGPVPGWSTPIAWHGHEMVFGFAGAAVAGFLLTSVPVWTGRRPVAGAALAALASLWLAGRGAVFFASQPLFSWLAAIVDTAFLVAVSLAIAGPIYGSRSRRNYAFPLLLLALAAANGLTHLGARGISPEASGIGIRLGVGILLLLVGTLGGRLVPLFTEAALKRAGSAVAIVRVPWADAASAPVLGAFVVSDTLWPGSSTSCALALIAAAIFALRMKGWGLRHAFGDPLLWSMHVAYLWLPVGLVALGIGSASASAGARNFALHALTVGTIGGMILAIMTRVALGHTGRAFRAPRGIAVAYALVHVAAVVRTFAPLLVPMWTGELLIAAGVAWVAAFAIFLAVYTPFLVAPRIDGQPG